MISDAEISDNEELEVAFVEEKKIRYYCFA